jgi:glycosyltransferase involved in cell wall biosynthesis
MKQASSEPTSMIGNLAGVAIAVCTRNRPGDLIECIRSILAIPGDFELLVVDQSDVPTPIDAIPEFSGDRRLRYHASMSRGLSRARNEALRATQAEVLAFTDDDCRVSPLWIRSFSQLFASEPDLALAYGRVTAPEHLWKVGFIATFEIQGSVRYKGRLPEPLEPWGIGANMVLRRRVVMDLGGFDPFLGAGTPMYGGEELDLTMRAIGAGHAVVCTGDFEVTHLGVRPHAIARAQYRNYAIGAGAAYGKNMRLGTPGVRALFSRTMLQQLKGVLSAAARGRRPRGLGMLLATLSGAVQTLKLKLNRQMRSFEERPGGP